MEVEDEDGDAALDEDEDHDGGLGTDMMEVAQQRAQGR